MRSIAKKNTSLEVFWYMLSRLLLYASLTPAALAALASDALRRLAVFFLSKPFLTALSRARSGPDSERQRLARQRRP